MLAEEQAGKLEFDDIVRLDDTVATYAFHVGDVRVTIPMLGIDFILGGDESSNLLRELKLRHLSHSSARMIRSAISYYKRQEMEFYWKVDCLLDNQGEFESAAAEIKEYLFKGLRTTLQSYVISHIVEAFDGRSH